MSLSQLFIDGRFVDATGGRTYTTLDPGTGQPVGAVAAATAADAEAAVEAAHRAFESGTWSGLDPADRARAVMDLADRVEGAAARLALTEALDSGGLVRRTSSDMIQAARYMRTVAQFAAHEFPWREPVRGAPNPFLPSRNYVRREPLGVCAGIIPWNFPFLMAVWKVAPAILMGNTVVLKPATPTPLSALLLAELVSECAIPAGVVNVVTGSGAEVGRVLATDPRVAKVAFTGSTEVGRDIMRMGADTVKKVTLELGGKSPNIVLDDADPDLAIDGALFACFLHSGQVCESGTRLLVPASLHDSFVERLAARAEGIRIGYQLDPRSKMGPVVSDAQLATIEDYVRIGREEGAELVAGGERAEVPGMEGWYFRPTIFAGVRNDMRIAREEIFGPVLSVIRYDDEEEAVAIANDSDYGLGGGVWSRDLERAERVAARIQTGTVWINDFHAFSDMAPFGGYKQSGVGRELGPHGLEEYTQLKHVHVGLASRPEDKLGFHLLLKEPRPSSFTYLAPTHIFSGPGSLARLDLEVGELGCERLLLVADVGVERAGLVDRVRTLLGSRIVAEFLDVPQDSGLDVVDAAADAGRAARADGVLCLGGGSVIDTAKVAAVVLGAGGRAIDHVGYQRLTVPTAPLVVVPTTAGTGSEVTNAAVIKHVALGRKVLVVSDRLFPSIAILDPTLLASLPPGMTASTGFDALTHAIEAVTSRISSPMSDGHALEAIRLLAADLPTCVSDGADLGARGRVQTAATLAGLAIAQAQVGLVHGMSHAIGVRCGVPHGTGNGILLPHVMRFNAEVAAAKLARVAEAMGVARHGRDDAAMALAAADAVSELLERCAHPTRLAEVGVAEEVLDECAGVALVDPCSVFNARPVKDPTQIAALYRTALGG